METRLPVFLNQQKHAKPAENVHDVLGYLSEVFSEELCLPRAKLEFKKENFTVKETVMSCFKVFQFKKNLFDLNSGFQNEFHLGEKTHLALTASRLV